MAPSHSRAGKIRREPIAIRSRPMCGGAMYRFRGRDRTMCPRAMLRVGQKNNVMSLRSQYFIPPSSCRPLCSPVA
jgi:hypothetical protein